MMQALAYMYEKPSANNKVYLMKKLYNLRMPEGGQVVEHLYSFNTTVNQLVSVEIKFDDEIHALILLASLSNSYKPMRVAITNSIRNAKLQLIDIRNTILVEEVRRKDSDNVSTSNSTLNVDNKERSSERNSNKGNGDRGKSKNGRGKSRNDRNLECQNCGKTGHLKKNCITLRKNEDKNNDIANTIIDEFCDALISLVDDS